MSLSILTENLQASLANDKLSVGLDENGSDDYENEALERVALPKESPRSPSIGDGSSPASPSLERLSIDILAWLLSYLSLSDIIQVTLVSKRLRNACRANALWKLKFENRWKIDETFRVIVTGQNWYKAYQAAYRNPHDLWIFHWNNCFPQDGLIPGRCCIYDRGMPTSISIKIAPHNLCPPCRFFPNHPLQYFQKSYRERTPCKLPKPGQEQREPSPETIAEATDCSIHDFCQHYGISNQSVDIPGTFPYSIQKAKRAFSEAATFHRTINTQQYTAASPRHESEHSVCFAQLQDLLFFDVTEEPLSTTEGAKELQHLREERDSQLEWEQASPFTREQRRCPPQDFLKPAFETSHHSWHQAVLTNPDFVRPLVFRISVARPDCFTVFPSEGFLNAGESMVVTFGVRPLGSLVATAFEIINAQRHDVDDWMKQVYKEEGTLPCQPFVLRYKYGSVIPCIPALGFIPPHRSQLRQEIADNNNQRDHVEDILWRNKQVIDYHWSGGDSANVALENEIRSIQLSAHVNAHYPFSRFRNHTLTPFDLSIEPSQQAECSFPMLYFAAPQLYEFYSKSVYPRLQEVHLETEVSHAGHVFRSHRQKCIICQRTSWGTRLEEMGQAFVLSRLEDWVWQRHQTTMIQHALTIVKALSDDQKQIEQAQSTHNKHIEIQSSEQKLSANEAVLKRSQQLLFVTQKMITRYRAAPYINKQLRDILIRFEILADYLYGINMQQIVATTGTPLKPWRKAGIYRYATSTLSVFDHQNDLGLDFPELDKLVKDEPVDMDPFRRLLHTPGNFNLGPQEDSNHPGELLPPKSWLGTSWNQPASATDMFMNDPIQSFRGALITLSDPRSVLVHGIYDRVPYPGKVVRRPKNLQWLRPGKRQSTEDGCTNMLAEDSFYHLQDALDLHFLLPSSPPDICRSFSLRRYLRNIPPLGMSRFPMCIDDGCAPKDHFQSQENDSVISTTDKMRPDDVEDFITPELKQPLTSDSDCYFSPSYRLVELTLPEPRRNVRQGAVMESARGAQISSILQSDMFRSVNQRRDEFRGGVEIANNHFDGGGNIHGGPPLLPGPGPRLLNLLWTISAQIGWAIDDGNHGTSSVYVKRELLIALQWLSLTLMAIPLLWTLVARASGWVPCKPVDYLVDLPYQLTNEMRYLSENECGLAAFALVVIWLFLGRWTERSTGRDWQRQMLDHARPKKKHQATTFFERLKLRYERRWDECCPILLQRLSYTCSWNRQSCSNLMNSLLSWCGDDGREYKSVFNTSTGRGLLRSGQHWRDIIVEDHSSQKLVLAAISALGSFSCSTPHFWMNVLTVFSTSISLGLSMSVASLEKGVAGGTNMSTLLKSKLVTLVTLTTLLGQLLGSSGGVLFLAEFVVTSISFILGGAGTISASSVESWGCFFCLSTAAFWGCLLARVALLEGIIIQKRFVVNSLVSTSLLCSSLVALVFFWLWISFWRWDVPASLVIMRTGLSVTETAGGDKVSAASGTVARKAAAEYAAKNLQ